jgi:hypothetical protein
MSLKTLQGKKIVFTGFRDEQLAENIVKLGGIVTTSLSNQTDIVVYEGEKGAKSEKKLKAESMGKLVFSKDNFVKKFIIKTKKSPNGIWNKLFGFKDSPKKQEKKKTQSKKTPLYDVETIIKEPISYLIHDNGGRPFQVNLTDTKFSVFKQAIYEGPYAKAIVKPTSYKRVFVGTCPDYGKKFDGNSILVHVKGNEYIYIGSEIYKMTLDNDTIIGYKSPVGNSDVPYPYAYGEKNTYLFLEESYIPNDLLTFVQDPYIQYYGLSKKKAEQYKYKTTLIHKRL